MRAPGRSWADVSFRVFGLRHSWPREPNYIYLSTVSYHWQHGRVQRSCPTGSDHSLHVCLRGFVCLSVRPFEAKNEKQQKTLLSLSLSLARSLQNTDKSRSNGLQWINKSHLLKIGTCYCQYENKKKQIKSTINLYLLLEKSRIM